MTSPFILVSRYKLKEGQLQNYQGWVEGLSDFVKSREPRMIAFHVYANEEGSEVTGIQVHPDAASMESHMDIVREYIQTAFGDFFESTNLLLACGEGEAARAMMEQITPPNTPLTAMPQHLGGFTRSSAAP
jgi:hypothetical protein